MSKLIKERPKITDWIQAIAAVIAAVGLFITLWLQAINTRYQIDLSKRDYDRYINDIAPQFQVSRRIVKKDTFTISIKILQNTAYDLKIKNNSNQYFDLFGISRIGEDLPAGEVILLEGRIHPFFRDDRKQFEKSYIGVDLQYEDKLGNKYTQSFSMEYDSTRFSRSVPNFTPKTNASDSGLIRYFNYR